MWFPVGRVKSVVARVVLYEKWSITELVVGTANSQIACNFTMETNQGGEKEENILRSRLR